MSTLTLAAVQSGATTAPAHAWECALADGWRQCGPWCPAHTPEVLVDALDLRPGMVVVDDYTAWAEVVTAERVTARPSVTRGYVNGSDAVNVTWLLADGQRETIPHEVTDCFSLLPAKPRLCAKDDCYRAASGPGRPDDNPDYCRDCNAAWWDAVLAP